MAKVLIDDENPVLRLGLEASLSGVPGLEIVRGAGLAEGMRRHAPEVVVIGAVVPPLEVIGDLAGMDGPRIVVVTAADDPWTLVRTVEVGAHCCLVHGHFGPGDLARAVLDAARGGSHLSPPVVTALVDLLHGAAGASGRPGLTRRETEIMEFIATGLGNRAIAARLVISEKTVKNHIHSIYRRLRVGSRAHAIARWRELT